MALDFACQPVVGFIISRRKLIVSGLCFVPYEMFLLNSLLVINMLIKGIKVRIISLITRRMKVHRENAG
jgi:hypothetical protein